MKPETADVSLAKGRDASQWLGSVEETRKVVPLFERKLSPCALQTAAEIESYYRNQPEGSQAVVRRTHGGILSYELTAFRLRRPRSGRINVDGVGDFFMKSGKNCWEPTGQTRLVVPTDEVCSWAIYNPRGEMGYSIYPEEPSWRRVT